MISNLKSAKALIQADLDHARNVLQLWQDQVDELEKALAQLDAVDTSRAVLRVEYAGQKGSAPMLSAEKTTTQGGQRQENRCAFGAERTWQCDRQGWRGIQAAKKSACSQIQRGCGIRCHGGYRSHKTPRTGRKKGSCAVGREIQRSGIGQKLVWTRAPAGMAEWRSGSISGVKPGIKQQRQSGCA
jgi:hypothetical protein